MKTFQFVSGFKAALGTFDGLHIAHNKILEDSAYLSDDQLDYFYNTIIKNKK